MLSEDPILLSVCNHEIYIYNCIEIISWSINKIVCRRATWLVTEKG